MSSYFQLKPKLLVAVFVYMILVYGFSTAFVSTSWATVSIGNSEKNYFYDTAPKAPGVVAKEAKENKSMWSEVFGIVLVAVGVTLLLIPGLQPAGIVTLVGGAGIVGGGALVAYSFLEQAGVRVPFLSDAVDIGYTLMGSIVSFFNMLFNFLTFQEFPIGTGVDIPSEVGIILFLLVLPCWLLILFWIIPTGIEVLKAIISKISIIRS